MKKATLILLLIALLLSFLGCSILGNDDPGYSNYSDNSNYVPAPVLQNFSFPEATIINTQSFKVTAKSVDQNSVNLLYENFSNKAVECTAVLYSANEFYINELGYFHSYDRLPANDKLESTLFIDDEMLLSLGIRSVETLQIRCIIRYLDEEIIFDEVYTFGTADGTVSANAFYHGLNSGEYSAITENTLVYASNETLYDKNSLRIDTVAIVQDKYGADTLCLDIVNIGNNDCNVEIKNVTLNGLLLKTYGAYGRIPSNKHSLFEISLLDVLIEDDIRKSFHIPDIAEITFNVNGTIVSVKIPGKQSELNRGGIIIYNTQDIKIVHREVFAKKINVGGLKNNDFQSYYSLLYYIENTSDKTLYVKLDKQNFFLNYTKTPLSSGHCEIPAGYCGYMLIETDYNNSQVNETYDASSIREIELNLTTRLDFDLDTEETWRISYSVR